MWKLTRNSSGEEIANVNFLYVLQNTIISCINADTDRLGYVLECIFTKFSEIMQCKGPLCRLKSFKVTDFGANRKLIYDFLLVINTNLPPILHRFQVIISQSCCFHYNACITRINTMIVKHRNRCQNDILA